MATSQVPPSVPWHFTELDDRIFQIRGRTFFFVAVLFAVIILVTFIFLYARWVFRFHRLTAFSAAVHGGLPLTSSPPHQGLDPTEINWLPITLYKAAAESEDDPTAAAAAGECCICLGVFEDGEKVKILPPCRHCYHSECVDRWLRSRSSCPLCRVTLCVNTPKNLQMV